MHSDQLAPSPEYKNTYYAHFLAFNFPLLTTPHTRADDGRPGCSSGSNG